MCQIPRAVFLVSQKGMAVFPLLDSLRPSHGHSHSLRLTLGRLQRQLWHRGWNPSPEPQKAAAFLAAPAHHKVLPSWVLHELALLSSGPLRRPAGMEQPCVLHCLWHCASPAHLGPRASLTASEVRWLPRECIASGRFVHHLLQCVRTFVAWTMVSCIYVQAPSPQGRL